MNASELKRWHDHVLASAKGILEEDHRLHPVAFVLTKMMHVDARTRAICISSEDWQAVNDDGRTPLACVCLLVPLNYVHPPLLLDFMRYLEKPGTEGTMDALIAKAPQFGVDNAPAAIIRSFEKMGVFGKDIVARFLKELCRRSEAEAIVKVDEVWMRSIRPETGETVQESRKKAPDSLEDDPLATEMLFASMETKDFQRILSVPFTRTERNKGAISGFGSISEQCSDSAEGWKYEGRFTGFLFKPEARP